MARGWAITPAPGAAHPSNRLTIPLARVVQEARREMSVTPISGTLADVEAKERTPRSKVSDYAALIIGIAPIVLLLLAALFLPLPYSPTHPNVAAISQAPSSSHIFGT